MKLYLALILLFSGVSSLLPAQSKTLSDADFTIRDSVHIPTRSGIDISAIVVRKKTNTTPLPAVLFYTTYFQGIKDSYFGKLSADRDYVGIVAYARGVRSDLKHYAPYEHEGTDIYDIIDWISKQDWCNGSVGMYGGSYTGFSQWATAKNLHPALKTIVPQVAVMPGFDMPMENNVQTSNSLSWANDHIYKNPPIREDLPFVWYKKGSAYRNLDSLAGIHNPIFQKWLQHPAYDAYWQAMVPSPQEYAHINIPVLSTTGYYDGAQIAALQYFRLHTRYNKQANHYIVIGPYNHWGGQRKPEAKLMGYAIDSVANISMMELAYQWLDYILKGKEKPALLKDKVNYQVMGTNSWKHAPSLQAMNNDTLTFYLNPVKSEDHYLLSATKPKSGMYATQQVDFKNRDEQNNYFTPNIVLDSLDASNGKVFMSEPFETPCQVNGSFIGNLFASITKKDMDISLCLYELMPDGHYFYMSRYVGRASYAKDNSQRHLLTPGKKESIPFEITRFVSKQIGKGSRLLVVLNINKHPYEIINYGSGKTVADETIKDAGEPLNIKWFGDSFIKVPVWKD